MKWIKLSDELPPFNKEIVLLSERGSTRLTFRKTKEATDKFQALLRNACKRIANIDNPSPMYNDNHEWREGYHVQYTNPDGSTYDSWSPKQVFENSYNVCDEGQVAMVCFPLTHGSINKAISLLTLGGADDKMLEEVAAKIENLKKKGFAIISPEFYKQGDEGRQFEMMLPLLGLGISV